MEKTESEEKIEKMSQPQVSDWLRVDAAFHFVLGVVLFLVPSLALRVTISDTTDGVHWHLARCLGAQMVGEGLVYWFIAKSNHAPAQATALKSRIVGATLWIAMSLHAQEFYSKHHTSLAIPLNIGTCVVLLVATFYQLVDSGWQTGQVLFAKNHFFNCLVQLDSFAACVIGCAWMAFPEWILSSLVSTPLTGAHLYLARCIGVIFVSTKVMSAQTLYWQHPDARKMSVYGRAVMCVGILSAQVFAQLALGQWWTGGHWVVVLLFAIWTSLAVWAVGNFQSGKFE